MKKRTILGAAVLSSSVLLLTPLTTQAASPAIYAYGCYPNNNQFIANQNSCNFLPNGTIVLSGLGNCIIPGFTLPDFSCPNPDIIVPPNSGCENGNPVLPDINEPDINEPDHNEPENNLPSIPDIEAPSLPDGNIPENNKPETNKPEINVPDSDNSQKPGDEDPETPPQDNTETDDTEQNTFIKQVVNLVNIERAKVGLSPLTIDSNMEKAALVRSKEIQKSFSHTRPNGSSFSTALKEAGISYNYAGENIAWGQKTPTEVVNAWMSSSGHRANILSTSFSRIGVGYTENQSGTGYWVQLFAN